jgi:hypothetical protein
MRTSDASRLRGRVKVQAVLGSVTDQFTDPHWAMLCPAYSKPSMILLGRSETTNMSST